MRREQREREEREQQKERRLDDLVKRVYVFLIVMVFALVRYFGKREVGWSCSVGLENSDVLFGTALFRVMQSRWDVKL